MFLNCSTCFGRHTAHSQEFKNYNFSLWFYVRFCHRSGWQPKTYVKSEAEIIIFELLTMGGVSPETCWAIKKHWNNKFYYTVASCWFFLWDFGYTIFFPLCLMLCCLWWHFIVFIFSPTLLGLKVRIENYWNQNLELWPPHAEPCIRTKCSYGKSRKI